MSKLKVGHVGGRSGYSSLFDSHPRTELVAVCDVNPEVLMEAKKNFGLKDSQCFQNYDAFLETDLDIVFIGTPIPFHSEQAVKALESGRHVLSEVTVAKTIEDCERLVKTVRETGMKYMMAENMCYLHFVREWGEMVQGGKLGEIFYAEGEYIHQIRHLIRDPETGELRWRSDRPPLHYCSHSLGPLLMILQDRVVKATASGESTKIMPGVGAGAIDIQVGLFETEKGTTIKILRSSVVAREPPFHFYTIYGTKGCVENGRLGFGTLSSTSTTRGMLYIEELDENAREMDWFISDPGAPEEAWRGGHGTSEYYLIRDFIDSIDNDTDPPIDVVKAVDMTVPGIIAHQAVLKGNIWLDVPHFE